MAADITLTSVVDAELPRIILYTASRVSTNRAFCSGVRALVTATREQTKTRIVTPMIAIVKGTELNSIYKLLSSEGGEGDTGGRKRGGVNGGDIGGYSAR